MASQDDIASLKATFRSLDPAIKLALSKAASSPMRVGLAALVLAHDLGGVSRLSVIHISQLLEEAGVAVTPIRLTRAFARAGTHVTRSVVDGEVYFRAMTSALALVEPIISSGPIQVIHIEAGKPRSARKKLEELLAPLTGLLRICDPYYGLRTLDALALIPSSCQVRFLSSRSSEKSAKLAGPLIDFRREHPNIQLRVLPPPVPIHDRYILSDETLMLLGHGIKDIGSKESFVVVVSASYARDLLRLLESSFDQHWAKASHL
jgi:hypothetical protein